MGHLASDQPANLFVQGSDEVLTCLEYMHLGVLAVGLVGWVLWLQALSVVDARLAGMRAGGAAEASARPGRGTPGRERKMSRRFVECLESIAS